MIINFLNLNNIFGTYLLRNDKISQSQCGQREDGTLARFLYFE